MHLQHNLIWCSLHIDEHITVHITVQIAVPTNIRFSNYVLFKIMASKNHIYIYYIPAIRYTYLNLDANVIFVPKREIGHEFHYVLICPVLCNDHHHGWIKKLYRKFPSMYKLSELVSTNLTAATVCNKHHTKILVLPIV